MPYIENFSPARQPNVIIFLTVLGRFQVEQQPAYFAYGQTALFRTGSPVQKEGTVWAESWGSNRVISPSVSPISSRHAPPTRLSLVVLLLEECWLLLPRRYRGVEIVQYSARGMCVGRELGVKPYHQSVCLSHLIPLRHTHRRLSGIVRGECVWAESWGSNRVISPSVSPISSRHAPPTRMSLVVLLLEECWLLLPRRYRGVEIVQYSARGMCVGRELGVKPYHQSICLSHLIPSRPTHTIVRGECVWAESWGSNRIISPSVSPISSRHAPPTRMSLVVLLLEECWLLLPRRYRGVEIVQYSARGMCVGRELGANRIISPSVSPISSRHATPTRMSLVVLLLEECWLLLPRRYRGVEIVQYSARGMCVGRELGVKPYHQSVCLSHLIPPCHTHTSVAGRYASCVRSAGNVCLDGTDALR
ncbi:hypothetical protein J6590_016340 [Homalodisca vitripennis]|nr:hypothetical protein J6590_016340 [Homalodisca vitripennis]